MIKCGCGKTMEKLPAWLEGVKVDFVCNNCPDRRTKNIAFVTLETEPKPKVLDDEIDEVGLGEDDED